MPNKPRTQHRSVRVDDPEWSDLEDGAALVGLDRSKVINQLIEHWLGRPGTEYPPQPTPEQMAQIVAAREAREAEINRIALTLECPICKVQQGECNMGRTRTPDYTIHRQRWAAAVKVYEKATEEQDGSR